MKIFFSLSLCIFLATSCETKKAINDSNIEDSQSWSIYDFEKIKEINDSNEIFNFYKNDLMEYIALSSNENLDSIRDMASMALMHSDNYDVFLYYYARERVLRFIQQKEKNEYFYFDSITSDDLNYLNIEENLLDHILLEIQTNKGAKIK